jgi:hypothetical protein
VSYPFVHTLIENMGGLIKMMLKTINKLQSINKNHTMGRFPQKRPLGLLSNILNYANGNYIQSIAMGTHEFFPKDS